MATPKVQTPSPVYGFLKQPSMIDFPGRLAAVLFVAGCNFRCGFCHNPPLTGPPRPGLAWENIEEAFRQFKRQWVDGVVISGGEPTLRAAELGRLLELCRQFGFAIKLDTNGSRPEVLREVLPRLDFVAMDVKCALEDYPEFVGFPRPQAIADSIGHLRNSAVAHEFRTTVIESFHHEAQIMAIGGVIRPARRYVLQAFIPRPDLPDPAMRETTRTRPDYLRRLKEKLEAAECAREVVVR